VSDGMICSARELGLGDDHTGILVLRAGEAAPGDDAIALLGLRDDVLDIAVTPDRGYCLSMRGVAREVATAYGVPFRDPASGAGPAGQLASGGEASSRRDLPGRPDGPGGGAGGYPVRVADRE